MQVSVSMKERIDSLSREDIARLIRFGGSEDEIFHGGNYNYLKDRFDSLGGMSSELSKSIGWGR